ncbi:Ubiquitin carboxyl-terminal hydrolase CYLD [Liparis tanakae]|uniref:Ubiquitin carboxyl-terminal hydrolase CYLD n=1 Tax=Liparis tanakae TaxID=230148 RepID=A0A4Z2GKU7_9TELE|nr:Ubiquitin carboxyl-terminal hydrolase CYLD [Liparis tanakae]
MSAAHDQVKKRRPPKVFLISTDLNVQDELDGPILLQRGWICHEQDSGRNRGDSSWVKVLDNSSMLKIERKFLLEVPTELNGLLEPVSDPEARLRLLGNPGKLQLLASLPPDAPLWVQTTGSQDELAEADLKYVGPLTPGGGVLFGVQLKGSAVGKGTGSGSYKGQRLFSCPDGCSLFVPVSHVRLRSWTHEPSREPPARERERERERERHPHRHHLRSRSNAADRPGPAQQQHHSRHAGLHPRRSASPPPAPPPGVLSRAAESAHNQVQVRGPGLHVGQRVSFDSGGGGGVHGGEVRFCGPLPGRSSSGSYVGVLMDAPVGNWGGVYKGEKLCHIPNPLYGLLLPGNKVYAESRSQRHPPSPRVSLQPAPPPLAKPGAASPSTSAPRVALMPPGKPALKPPPLPLSLSPPLPLSLPPLLPPKPTHGAPPPLPPPKPGRGPAAPGGERLQHNGAHRPPSPMRSPDGSDEAREDDEEEDEEEEEEEQEEEEAGPEGELEVGSMVEVNDPPLVGVIRWIGLIAGVTEPVAGIELVHSHRKRASHAPVSVAVPGGPWAGPLLCARQRMSLFAVTSIETSHYACPEVGSFLGLSEDELARVDPASLQESARRLLCDSYMCLYHSPELSLYK